MSLVEQRKHSQPLIQVSLVEQYTNSPPPPRVLIIRASNHRQIKQACINTHFKIKLPHI